MNKIIMVSVCMVLSGCISWDDTPKPPYMDTLLEYHIRDEAFMHGCLAGWAESEIKRDGPYSNLYDIKLECEKARSRILCSRFGDCNDRKSIPDRSRSNL